VLAPITYTKNCRVRASRHGNHCCCAQVCVRTFNGKHGCSGSMIKDSGTLTPNFDKQLRYYLNGRHLRKSAHCLWYQHNMIASELQLMLLGCHKSAAHSFLTTLGSCNSISMVGVLRKLHTAYAISTHVIRASLELQLMLGCTQDCRAFAHDLSRYFT
jgi:hypothetical protein